MQLFIYVEFISHIYRLVCALVLVHLFFSRATHISAKYIALEPLLMVSKCGNWVILYITLDLDLDLKKMKGFKKSKDQYQ